MLYKFFNSPSSKLFYVIHIDTNMSEILFNTFKTTSVVYLLSTCSLIHLRLENSNPTLLNWLMISKHLDKLLANCYVPKISSGDLHSLRQDRRVVQSLYQLLECLIDTNYQQFKVGYKVGGGGRKRVWV